MQAKKVLFVVTLVLPYLIITGMFFKAILPLWTGEPVLLKVHPNDPRDLMRGQYVALRYDFSTLDPAKIKYSVQPNHEYNYGDTLYLQLERGSASQNIRVARPVKLLDVPPSGELFIKVTPRYSFTLSDQKVSSTSSIELKAGIESFFVDKVSAKELEKQAQQNKLAAKVFITSSGEVRIADLVGQP